MSIMDAIFGRSKARGGALGRALAIAICMAVGYSLFGPSIKPAEGQTGGGGSRPGEIDSIDRDLAGVLDELQRLGEDEEVATEQYLRAEDELGKAQAAEASATAAVEDARRRLGIAYDLLARRMAAAYKRGSDVSYRVSPLLEARSFAEAGAASKVISLILKEDEMAVVSWKETEKDRREAEAELARITEQRAAHAAEAAERLDQIRSAIRRKEEYRAGLESRKRALLEAYEREQKRRQEEAASAIRGGSGGRFRVTGASSERVARAVEIALDQLGKPYRYGGSGPDSFDCSGLVLYAFSQAGFGGIPHRADLQYFLTDIHPARSELKPGDLVFFSRPGTPEGIHHNGIYVGDGMMVHAPQTGDVVKLSSIGRSDYFGATRLA
jgi:cell wall-associated NlpC family hydrolase